MSEGRTNEYHFQISGPNGPPSFGRSFGLGDNLAMAPQQTEEKRKGGRPLPGGGAAFPVYVFERTALAYAYSAGSGVFSSNRPMAISPRCSISRRNKSCSHSGERKVISVLFGKGHEDYQEIKGVRYPFDERVVIKGILEDLKK